MALGSKGVISAAANIIPEIISEMTYLCLSGKVLTAANLQIEYAALIDALYSEVNPIPIKAAMKLFGMCSDHTRLPLCTISAQNLQSLIAALSRAGLY